MLLPSWARIAWAGIAPRGAPGAAPELVVQGVILSERGVLLSVRSDLRGWELPGGNLEPGESEPDALRREIYEETGLEVEVGRHVGDYVRSGFHAHTARVFRCRVAGGALRASREAPVLRWFPPDAPPGTLFPWYRAPLRDALAASGEPVVRRDEQGLAAIWAGMTIDLRMRLSDDEAE